MINDAINGANIPDRDEQSPARDRFADTRNQSLTRERDVPVARPNRRQGRGEIALYGQRRAYDLSGAHASRLRAVPLAKRSRDTRPLLVKQGQKRINPVGSGGREMPGPRRSQISINLLD